MKSSLNKVLVVLLVVQVAILVGARMFGGEAYRPEVKVKGDLLFPDAAKEPIVEIDLTRDGRTTELKREGETWKVASEGGALADQQACKQAAEALGKLKPGAIVSDNKEKHEAFDVAGKNAVAITAKTNTGSEAGKLVLGKSTPDWSGCYVLYPPDSNDVMLVKDNVRHIFARGDNQPGSWRDKTIFKAEDKDVRGFEIVRADETLEFERVLSPSKEAGKENEKVATDDDEWKLVKPFEQTLDKFTGSAMARNFASLSCDSFHQGKETPAELQLDPPKHKITAKLADGSTLVLEVGKEDGGSVFARKAGGTEIYKIASYRLFNFTKKAADFKPTPPPEPPKPPEPGTPPAPEVPPTDKPAETPANGGG